MIAKTYLLFSLLFFVSFVGASSEISLIRDSDWSVNLTGVFHSSLALGDIDNDGDKDIVGMGCTAGGVDTCTTTDQIRVYVNNGTTVNENSTWGQNLTNLGYGSLALGDIDNDGDLDLIALGDVGGGVGDVKVYVNNGTSFNEGLTWELGIASVDAYAGSIALGDIDNDGDLDLALSGAFPSSDNGIYINNGTSFVKDNGWIGSFPYAGHGLGMSSLVFGDLDFDGDLDLVFAGSRSINFYSAVYINNGTSLIDNSSWKGDFTATFGWPSLALGDYDNDGDLDLVAIGTRAGDHQKFYNNTGSTFSFIQEFGSFFDGSIAFGDYDNDGDLDLVSMGKESGRNNIFTNNVSVFGVDIFEQQDMRDDNMQQGGLAWSDLDGDGNVDLVINGKQGNSAVYNFTIYISNASQSVNNTLPFAPNSSFSSNFSNGVLNLSWGNGSDSETPDLGLYYNLMVGNSTTNHTIVSGVYGGSSNPTSGYFGNMMQRKSISLNVDLTNGTYYWYVQTIDTGLAKSNWSAVQSFNVNNDSSVPNISSVASSSITSSTAMITWTTNEITNSTVYYGTSVALGSSSGSASLVISHSVSLSGLSASTTYYYNVSSCDYWGNCNNSGQYSFATSAAPVVPVTPSGGGGSSGSSSSVVAEDVVELEKFDIDFSNVSSGTLKVKQGDVKTFSFNGEIEHSITVLALTATSATLLITSGPISVQIGLGEIKRIDVNQDSVDDFSIKLDFIVSGEASFSLMKLEGADIVAQEELDEAIKKEALFDVRIDVVNFFEVVKSGREVIAEIEAINVNNIGQVDVLVEYYLTSKEDNLTKLIEGSDTLAVEAVASFVRGLRVPYDVGSGKYLFNVDVSYKGEILASGSSEFRVVRGYWIVIVVVLFLVAIGGVVFYLWRIGMRETRLEKIVKRLRKGSSVK